jgi:hypothetical protein
MGRRLFGRIGRGPVWFRHEESWFGLEGKSSGIGWTVRVLYEKRSGYTAVWLVLGD